MRRALLLAAAALSAGGCAALRPGPTPDGQAVRVSARAPEAARRQAIEAMLPLFLTDEVRAEAREPLEKLVFSRAKEFVGRSRFPKRGAPAVEVLLDKLSAVLRGAGLAVPRGYAVGQEKVLVAIGKPETVPTLGDVVVGDSLRVTLFGRGVLARDLRDPFDEGNKSDAEKFRLLVETQTVAAASRGGWGWVVTGEVSGAVGRDAASKTSRAEARLDGRLYELGFSSVPFAFASSAAAVDVSTTSSLARALEQAGESAAAQIQTRIGQRRAGRATVALLLPGPKDLERVRGLLAALRGVPEVDGAVLFAWNGPYESMDVWVFARGLTPENLAAKLIHVVPDLRITGIDAEMREIFLETPMGGLE